MNREPPIFQREDYAVAFIILVAVLGFLATR